MIQFTNEMIGILDNMIYKYDKNGWTNRRTNNDLTFEEVENLVIAATKYVNNNKASLIQYESYTNPRYTGMTEDNRLIFEYEIISENPPREAGFYIVEKQGIFCKL